MAFPTWTWNNNVSSKWSIKDTVNYKYAKTLKLQIPLNKLMADEDKKHIHKYSSNDKDCILSLTILISCCTVIIKNNWESFQTTDARK